MKTVKSEDRKVMFTMHPVSFDKKKRESEKALQRSFQDTHKIWYIELDNALPDCIQYTDEIRMSFVHLSEIEQYLKRDFKSNFSTFSKALIQ